MAVTERVRTLLRQTAPATSGRVSESGFLLAGAGAGALGWGLTQFLAWFEPPLAPVLATAWWAVLVAGFGSLTVLHAPESLRFSDAMFVWGSVNGTAMLATIGGIAAAVPPRIAFWHAWVLASATGYAGTGALLARVGVRERAVGYLASSVVAVAVWLVGVRSFESVEPVAFLLVGALHVVPLVVDATGEWSGAERAVSVAGSVGLVLALGAVV